MGIELEKIEQKHRGINQKIREAEESRERGVPGASEWLQELKTAQSAKSKEERQAADREYLRRRGRDREQRSKFEKMLDAMRGDL